nr:patatin-like phospholipase family protein [Kibdelosporangium sp. MJ126-NF4]CEL12899.1 Patatin [Kibdelosporangium sp. MJ126-NF4]CTQ98583.1 Patatin [Kibdelosporangium sp. MJ126-NF4]
MTSRALVLGAGANSGFAWEWGVLTGLHDAGVKLVDADLIVGTSSGAMVGAQLTSGVDPHQLLQVLLTSPRPPDDGGATARGHNRYTDELRRLAADSDDPKKIMAGLGAMAATTDTALPEPVLRKTITHHLLASDWPRQRLVITAVDAESGELAVFDRDTGASLLDALTATHSLPGIWPPVAVGDRRYIDGCVRSPTNVDLAAGHDRVVVLAPMADTPHMPGSNVLEQVEPLREHARVEVVQPDESARAAIDETTQGGSRMAAVTRAGIAQAASLVESLGALWQD